MRERSPDGRPRTPALNDAHPDEFVRRRPWTVTDGDAPVGADVLSPQLGRVASKPGVRDRAQIVVWAFQHGVA